MAWTNLFVRTYLNSKTIKRIPSRVFYVNGYINLYGAIHKIKGPVRNTLHHPVDRGYLQRYPVAIVQSWIDGTLLTYFRRMSYIHGYLVHIKRNWSIVITKLCESSHIIFFLVIIKVLFFAFAYSAVFLFKI